MSDLKIIASFFNNYKDQMKNKKIQTWIFNVRCDVGQIPHRPAAVVSDLRVVRLKVASQGLHAARLNDCRLVQRTDGQNWKKRAKCQLQFLKCLYLLKIVAITSHGLVVKADNSQKEVVGQILDEI